MALTELSSPTATTTTTTNTNSGSTNNNTTTNNTTNGTTNSTTATSSKNNATLDKDAFLKLLLIELQHQDPTDPMDSDKMLTQTSQLAALEMQQNTNETMSKMVETMNQLSESMLANSNMSAVNAIGKMGVVSENYIKVNAGDDTDSQQMSIKMYFPKDTKEGATFQVIDKNGEKDKVVRTFKLTKDELKQGLNSIPWDLRNDDNAFVGAGNYTIKATYTDIDGNTSTAEFGKYPIEAVRFKDGKTYVKIAGTEYEFSKLSEIS